MLILSQIPLGILVPSSDVASTMMSANRYFRSVLSEYVVYDEARVGLKYLVRTRQEGGGYYGKGKGKGKTMQTARRKQYVNR